MREMYATSRHLPTMNNPIRFVFFGTPDIAVTSLNALRDAGLTPACIVTAPDTKQGRGMVLTPSPVAVWADAHGIPVLKPSKLSNHDIVLELQKSHADLFVVVAYGKIIPQTLLDIPKKGTLNMHPSLLPKHRGPSPIESQILLETDVHNVGVSVMLLDEKMDHGPVLAQESVADGLPEWPITASKLRSILGHRGAQLLAQTTPSYVAGIVSPTAQDDTDATYCALIKKEDAELNFSDDAYTNYLKILAYDVWPRAYFFTEKNGKKLRVVVTKARFENNELIIERVIPEGKKEIPYEVFLKTN